MCSLAQIGGSLPPPFPYTGEGPRSAPYTKRRQSPRSSQEWLMVIGLLYRRQRVKQLIYITWSLFSLVAALVRHLSSPSLIHVHPHLPLSKSQIALSVMHHPVFGIIFLSHSVNLVHHLSPPLLSLFSIPDVKLTCSTNPSHHRSSSTYRTAHWTSTGLPSRTPYHTALCFSSSVIFF